MKINGAIFDLDGTMLDSMYIWETIGSDYLISGGISPEPNLNKIFKKMSIVQAAEYYQKVYGLTDNVGDIVDGVNHMIEHLYADVVKLKPEIPELLCKMHEKYIKMCVATATDRYMVEAALKSNGIDKYFCGILTCTEAGYGKDSPKIFEKALKLLGTAKAHTLIFEDALHAIETAKKAGFKVAGVYDKSSDNETDKIKELCDEYITSFKEWSDKRL